MLADSPSHPRVRFAHNQYTYRHHHSYILHNYSVYGAITYPTLVMQANIRDATFASFMIG